MRELTVRETENIRGGWGVPGAGVGALTGAAGYLGHASTSGGFSWGGLASPHIAPSRSSSSRILLVFA